MILKVRSCFQFLLGLFLLTGLCLAREKDVPSDQGAGWVVGVVIGSMVFLCIVIVIIVCCVCKKSVSKDILIRPAETFDRDVYGLNKNVYHVGHLSHQQHHHHQHHAHSHSSRVHYDHNGYPIGQDSIHDEHVHVQPNGITTNVQIPSISVSYHSPEVSMDHTLTTHDQEPQTEQSVPTPNSENLAESNPPEST